MKTIFLKELRENAKWAALIAAVLSVWTYVRFALHDGSVLAQIQNVLAIMAPLAGLVLGITQYFFETRPDNWAFVVHRPVRRAALFTAKVIAGLLLLHLALGIPLLICALWSSHPGHAASPFYWGMTLAPLADVLQSTLWYFTGIVLTMRPARWYGSRLLPGSLALVTSAWVSWVPGLAMALIGAAVTIPFMAAAAASAFAARDTAAVAPRSLFPRLGLAASIFPSCLLLFLLAASLSSNFDKATAEVNYNVERDGRYVIMHRNIDGNGAFTITDLAGNPLPEYANLDPDSPALYDRWIHYWAPMNDDRWIGWPGSCAWTGYRSGARFSVAVDGGYGPGAKPPVRSWFNVKRRVIELYDQRTHLLTGTIAPGGFAPAGAPPLGQFPGKPLNVMLQRRNHTLAFNSAVYWMELDQRRVRQIFTAAPGDPVLSATDFEPPPDSSPGAVVLTSSHLHIIDPTGAHRFGMSAPLEIDHARYSGAVVTRLPSNNHYLASIWWEGDAETSFPVFEYTADGALVRRTDMPTLPIPKAVSPSYAIFMGIGTPLAAIPLYHTLYLERHFHIHRSMGTWWNLYLNCMIASAILSAVATMFLARHRRLSPISTIAWTLTSLLLGPSSLIIFLCLTEPPVTEPCPGCHRPHRVDQQLCPHCHSPHAPPPSDGREIFDPCDPLPSFA
jgi:hypothetical protein